MSQLLRNIFSSLNDNDFNFVRNYYLSAIQNVNHFYPTIQLTDIDLIGILQILFPYLNNFDKLKSITSLDQLYTLKSDDKYIFTNFQYDHGDMLNNNLVEMTFDRKLFDDNYKLFLLTLETTWHRLFINWNTIFPLTINVNDFTNTAIYKNTLYAINNKNLQIHNYGNKLIKYRHLPLVTIYNVLTNYVLKRNYINDKESVKRFTNLVEFIRGRIHGYPKYWINLTNEQQNNFVNILYLLSSDNKKHFINCIFVYLLYSGTLTIYDSNLITPDNKYYHYGNNYYFLTNQTYTETLKNVINTHNQDLNDFELKLTQKNIDNLKLEKKENQEKFNSGLINKLSPDEQFNFREEKKKDISFMENNNWWNKLFGLNWITQIKFFHRYLNNRVLFVTGGTGTGKSSQIPKLLLYGLKAFDYKMNGSILCTQPRKRPTEESAKNIAKQMGVNIPDFSSSNWLQFQHSDDNIHTSDKANNLTLKFVTDKIALNFLINNSMCMVVKSGKLKTYYDIIIIDEAHEHNVNMDIILSIMRNYLYYNNDLKLVIISATMENDEHNYRRYYRLINDNRKYPLSMFIVSNNINAVCVDRRIDISEPNKLTIYPVEDIYFNLTKKQQDDENYKNIKILEILNSELHKATTKDILIFKAGFSEIKKCIKVLQSNLPTNILIVPYLSTLETSVREFIETVHIIDRSKIKIDRNIDITTLTSSTSFYNGNGSYTKIIIIATNIAEASITIDTLTHVIDDGLQKVNIYNYAFNTYQLKKTLISETNRIQRRGRVGRSMSGTVYYLYPKDYLLNVKIYYKICIENVLPNMLDLLEIQNNITLFNQNFDPNVIDFARVYQNYIQNHHAGALLDNFLIRRYSISGNFYRYDLFNPNANDLNKFLNFQRENIYINQYGFTFKNLIDTDGIFYIISPNELNFERNLFGQIISKSTDIINHADFFTHKYYNINMITSSGPIVKSDFAKQIQTIVFKMNLIDEIDLYLTVGLVISYKWNCYKEFIILIILIKNYMNKNISNITSKTSNIQTLLNLYYNNKLPDFNKINKEIEFFEQRLNDNKQFINEGKKYISSITDIDNKEKITIILLILFSENMIRKILGKDNLFLNIFNLHPKNLKVISDNSNIINKENIFIYMFNTLITRMVNDKEITTNEVSMLHNIDFNLLKYIHSNIDINELKKQLQYYNNDEAIYDTIQNIIFLFENIKEKINIFIR